ncbi:competence type IV pilus minor pilin ComGD [Faecalicoccus acidiformans]|uniref:competence type IV pilus minor pilin ComGD n=1 Tax=Faecalicoccus acidiformans TaxID=915173 RepID=UPI003209D633
MGKPSVNNAFTLLEGLFVLLIISLLTLVTIFKPVSSSLKLFGNQILSYCVFTQEKAFMDKEQKNVEIKTDHAIFDKIRFNFPHSITCDPFTYHYNAKGNISQAHTIHCQNEQDSISLVFQLGSGRVRIE